MIAAAKIFFLSLIWLTSAGSALASGADALPLEADGTKWQELGLSKAGHAVFRYWGFRVYEATLYLPAHEHSRSNALSVRPKVLSLRYDRGFTAEEFLNSSREILKKNVRIDTAIAEACLNELSSLFQAVKPGDSYQLVHRKSGQLELHLNDSFLGTVCDENGTRAYFSIWLSKDHSIKEAFQRELLGESANVTEFIATKGEK